LTSIHHDYGYERSLELQNLFGSHDTARLGSAVVNPQYRQDHGAGVQGNRAYDIRKPNAAEKRRWKQMVAFQFLMPGAPYIYYGDEVGMWGADDPDCRKPMIWPDLKYADERAHPFGQPRAADNVSADSDLLNNYREWIGHRRELEVLRRGDFKVVLNDDARRLLAFRRSLDGDEIVAVFNASSLAAKVEASQFGITNPPAWNVGFKAGDASLSSQIIIPATSFAVLRRTNTN
jgi:cyclomaltodextrinase / maltogenic alpha-amylase / neopullulanase